MNKEFWKSKNFWTGVAGVITSIGLMLSGELDVQSFLVELVPGVLGLLSILFRWGASEPLGWSKK